MLSSHTIKVAGVEYDLRLTTRNTVKLENALGKNPLAIFMKVQNNELPTVQEIALVLYYGLQKHHGAEFQNMDAVYDLYDRFIEDGGDMISLIPELVELYKVSGLIPKEADIDSKN